MFLEAHREMSASVERIFPQADAAYLWDNNARDTAPVLIARCKRDEKIEIIDEGHWYRFQYKREREIDTDAEFEVIGSHVEKFMGKRRTIFEVKYTNLIRSRRDQVVIL